MGCATIIIITGIALKDREAITAGATVAGIAGTAYQTKDAKQDAKDQDTHTDL